MYLPEIEEGIPLPATAVDALPAMSPQEELEMRTRTIKFIADLTGQDLEPDEENRETAQALARQMIEDPQLRPNFATYSNETLAYLAGLVAQYNTAIVEELSDLKLYVVNKLVYEIEHAKDPKSRITALSKLGEIDGVDAFKRRSEMTVVHKSIEQVEKELFAVLENIEYRVIDEKKEAKFIENEQNLLPDPEKTENLSVFGEN